MENQNFPYSKQLIDLIPKGVLDNSIDLFSSDKHCSTYKTRDQLTAMFFGQLNKCLSLREITLGLGTTPEFIKDIGLLQSPAKSTMSDGNAKRDYKVFESIYSGLIKHYKGVYSKTPNYKSITEIEGRNIKIVDATTMSVCLNLFSWAKFRTAKGGIKMHTSLDEATMLPDMINITCAKTSDRRGADNFRYLKETIVVDDRGYYDVRLFKTRIEDQNHFVTRIKDNIKYQSIGENELPSDKDQHILKDELIYLTGKSAKEIGLNKVPLRRIAIYIEKDHRSIELITNNIEWSAATIVELYKRRWLVETFFKLLKQNLQVKTFLGTSENACKSQLFVALITYFLLELTRRSMSKVKHCFGHFATLIRICLMHYNGLKYIINEIRDIVKKAKQKTKKEPDKQYSMNLKDFLTGKSLIT